MNYRHAYHAGNFADVVKHAVLCRIMTHLRLKPAAFRVIDTHAGAGVYDLAGPEASKTSEWRGGIGRLMGAQVLGAQVLDAQALSAEAKMPEHARALLAPYLDAVKAVNPPGRLTAYPGSSALVRSMLRPQDRLIACELEPAAAAALAGTLRGDVRAKAIAIDGWTALAAYVPPKERRGLVLIDPPFEQPEEYSRLAQGLATAHRKWATGMYLLWYPVKDAAEVAAFIRKLARLGIGRMLRMELVVAMPSGAKGLPEAKGLRGGGLIAVNPPWTLHDELQVLLPALGAVLRRGGSPRPTLEWIA
jgi:23S rRNA (adenine2030-N6)-methyltransferase